MSTAVGVTGLEYRTTPVISMNGMHPCVAWCQTSLGPWAQGHCSSRILKQDFDILYSQTLSLKCWVRKFVKRPAMTIVTVT